MNHTQNYNLNQWEASDQLRRVDVNADNAKIDAALHGLESGKADKTALAAVEAKISRVVTGTYTGTGGTGGVRHISLPGRPKVVLIRTEYPGTSHHYKAIVMTDGAVFRFHTYNTATITALGNGYELEDDGFSVPSDCHQNYSGAPQYYLAVI